MDDGTSVQETVDPVCGMTVDLDDAREHGLVFGYDYREYGFCGKGCLNAFVKDPQGYVPAGGRDAP